MAKQPRLDSKGKALPDGVYENRNVPGEYYVVYDGPRHSDGRRNPKTEYSDAETGDRWTSSRKAAQYRANQIQKIKERKYIEPSRMTLREYLMGWLAEKAIGSKANTRISRQNAMKTFLDTPLAGTQLTRLTAKPIQTVLLTRIEEGLSVSSAKTYLAKLSDALEEAVTLKIIPENPARLVKLPKTKKKKVVILSPVEVNKFLDFIKETRHYDLTKFLFSSGARRGEALGLREEDCDFENGTVTFEQQVVSGEDGPLIQDELKTESSKRTISLDQDTLLALQHQIRLRKKERLRAGPSYQENGLVFAKTDGSPLDPKTITKWFARKGKEFGRPDLSVHVTRHTHTSLLLLSKDPVIPILAISKRLGHSSVSMTLDTYGHLLPNTDKEVADRMAEILERGVV